MHHTHTHTHACTHSHTIAKKNQKPLPTTSVRLTVWSLLRNTRKGLEVSFELLRQRLRMS